MDHFDTKSNTLETTLETTLESALGTVMKKPDKMLNMNYFEIINDDIRNFRKLNNYQMEYIKDLTNDEKMSYLIFIIIVLD